MCCSSVQGSESRPAGEQEREKEENTERKRAVETNRTVRLLVESFFAILFFGLG